MKTEAFAQTIVVALLLLTAGISSINFVGANPVGTIFEEREISPSSVNAQPPTIIFLSPENNNTVTSNLTLHCNISVGAAKTVDPGSIERSSYKGDWEQTQTPVLFRCAWDQNKTYVASNLTEFSTKLFVPEGKHNITVWASEIGGYQQDTGPGFKDLETIVVYTFHIASSATVTFTVDGTSPNVTVLSVENKTYSSSDLPLNFAVSEPISQITYSLDGKEKTAIAGNCTLTDLSNGNHNVTVYATDIAGNTGTSQTINFIVKVPFPTTFVITSSIFAVIV